VGGAVREGRRKEAAGARRVRRRRVRRSILVVLFAVCCTTCLSCDIRWMEMMIFFIMVVVGCWLFWVVVVWESAPDTL
jgi:Flp pilus assembly protein TadB